MIAKDEKFSTIVVENFFNIYYNLGGDIMDINEIKRTLMDYQKRVNDLWRSL